MGPGLPREMCPPWELALILRQTGLPRALGAQDVPRRGSKACLPGLLPTGQPSRWMRLDNTSPLLSGVRRFGEGLRGSLPRELQPPCAFPGARSYLHGCQLGS